MKKSPKPFLIYGLLFLLAVVVSQPAYCGSEEDDFSDFIEEEGYRSSSIVISPHKVKNVKRRELSEEDGLFSQDSLNIEESVSDINQKLMHFGIENASAVYICPPGETDNFPKNMDSSFFRPSSKKVKILQWGGSLYGVGVPIAMSGLILGSIGDVTGSVPGLDGTIEAIIVTTTFPVAARVGYERVGAIATSLFGEKKYTALGKDEDVLDSRPHTFTKNFAHKAALVICTAGAGLNALIPTMLMVSEEVPYFNAFAAVSAPFIWAFYADASYTLERRYLENFFNSYFYYTPIRVVKERALLEGLEKFLKFVNRSDEDSDSLVDTVYDTFIRILEQRRKLTKEQNVNGEESDVNEIMLFSLLMITQTMREDDERWASVNSTHEEQNIEGIELESKEIRELKRENKQLRTILQGLRKENKELAENVEKSSFFKKDVDAVKPIWQKAFMETASQLMVGAAFYARVEILKTTVDQLLQAVGVDPVTAGYIGYGVATPEVLFRTLVETNAHKEQFKGWLGAFSFSKLTNLPGLRKVASATAAFDGLIYSLPAVLVGLIAFEDYSTLAKVALITPAALLDFSIFSRLFSKHNDKIITGVATIRKSANQCIAGKRAHLTRLAEEAKRTLPKLHNETISELYKKLMKGS